MIEVLTFILVGAALAHLWLQLFNRFLLLGVESELKTLRMKVLFVGIIIVPLCLLLIFSHTTAVRQALAWQPDTTPARILFGAFGTIWIIGLWRLARWFQSRVWPERSRRSNDRVMIPTMPRGRPRLPWMLRPLETTYDLELVEREIVVPNLPAVFDGLTIAHVADVHFEPNRICKSFYRELARLVNDQQADVVVFTGDFINDERLISSAVKYHSRMRGRLATLGVLGNHDLWTKPSKIRDECARHGIHLMHNERWSIERRGRRLIFAGTDAPWIGLRSHWTTLLAKDSGDAVVLLSHTPDNAEAAACHGANLILSGHTHGGQFCLPLVGALVVPCRLGHRYVDGVYDIGSSSVLSVSRGIGSSANEKGAGGGRMLCPPEVIVYTLRSPAVDVAVPVAEESEKTTAGVVPITG